MPSRLEYCIDAIQDEFQQITVAGGYRNDLSTEQVIKTIRHPAMIQTFPEIGIQPITVETAPLDSGWTIFESQVDVRVAGRVKPYLDLTPDAVKMAEALDSLQHDMERIMAVLIKKYKVDSTSPWIVMDGGRWKVSRNTVLSPSIGFGEVVITFKVRLRTESGTFS
jgi:hypothetical protein